MIRVFDAASYMYALFSEESGPHLPNSPELGSSECNLIHKIANENELTFKNTSILVQTRDGPRRNE